ncbi:ribonuclease P protein component [Gracilaria domingensis]|nr:ribonuclease P protein component [Gracilaria domingensis]
MLFIRRPPSMECCDKPVPRARRLSLPTFRERRYLQDMHIERAKGRPIRFANTETFNLKIWPLTVTKPQDDRYAFSFAQFMERVNEEQTGISKHQESEFDYENTLHTAMKEQLEGESIYFEDEHAIADGLNDPEPGLCPVRFEIPRWAYIARIRAPKGVLGKRAVQRNRAKRRIRAAAAQIMPNHAKRGYEYIFSALPESLTSPFSAILEDVEQSLRTTFSWVNQLGEEELRRDMYCKR